MNKIKLNIKALYDGVRFNLQRFLFAANNFYMELIYKKFRKRSFMLRI